MTNITARIEKEETWVGITFARVSIVHNGREDFLCNCFESDLPALRDAIDSYLKQKEA